MKKLCPFRKEITKEESLSIAVTVTNIKTNFSECCGKECPYFNEIGVRYCNKVKKEIGK